MKIRWQVFFFFAWFRQSKSFIFDMHRFLPKRIYTLLFISSTGVWRNNYPSPFWYPQTTEQLLWDMMFDAVSSADWFSLRSLQLEVFIFSSIWFIYLSIFSWPKMAIKHIWAENVFNFFILNFLIFFFFSTVIRRHVLLPRFVGLSYV